ncbi:MAG: methyltransferase domain-containing protein [Anaerolineaceae bacterium]|nr:methyltransferase domain-containing protein [Anaerolineaceae bacterium]
MTEQNILAIIQARMSSSRLPGKVLRDLGGKPVLERVISRVSRSRYISSVVVATTADPSDDPIAEFCELHDTRLFRGSLYDVLDRYYQCARENQADVIVRITADCPMIDPQEIDRVIAAFLEGDCDFAANRLPPPQERTSPIGMDTEVCSFAALEDAWQHATEKYEREHVMPYLYETPGRFRVRVVDTAPDMGHLRFTIDTEEDLQVARAIYAAFGNEDYFSLEELLRVNAENPQWQHSLAGIQHKSFLDVDERAGAGAKVHESAPTLLADAKDVMPLPVSLQNADVHASPRCPLCGARQAHVLEQVSSFGFSVPYYHCGACGFVFQDVSISKAADPTFYAETYRKLYQATEEPTPKDLRQQSLRAADQVRFLRANLAAAPKRVLDIGASSGRMLLALREAYQAEAVGVEPGNAYRAQAEAQGLRMYPSLESLLASQPEPFELVSLMHVLEHFDDPLGSLRQVREKLLSPQGWLLLEVPNFYAHNSYELAHLSCFTPASLKEMLRKAGYRVVSLRKHGYPRSALFPLFLNVLAVPLENATEPPETRVESCVPFKRKLAMLWRRALSRLLPRKAWLPLEG